MILQESHIGKNREAKIEDVLFFPICDSCSIKGVIMSVCSPDRMKLQGFHIIREKKSLLMGNPCSFTGGDVKLN